MRVRTSKYLNNTIEQDHRRIKQRLRPMLGLKSFQTAAIVIGGIELAEKIQEGTVQTRQSGRLNGEHAGNLASCLGCLSRMTLNRKCWADRISLISNFAPEPQSRTSLQRTSTLGVAKFPQLSLSGLIGGQSTQSSSLFSGPHSPWSFVPQVTQPIFTAGRLRSNVRLAEAQRDSGLVQYQKTIQTAFTEVSNALIAHQRVRESRVQQQALVAALDDRKRLAYARYVGGVDTQLNALATPDPRGAQRLSAR